MHQLPESFEKEYWDLMIPIATEETTRSKRNLSISSFIIIAIYLLDKSLTDLRVLGLNLEGTSNVAVLYLAIALIIFWLLLFIASAFKDAELNKERRHLLKSVIAKIEESKNHYELKYSERDDSHPNKQTMKSIQREYQKYLDQLDRTKNARLLSVSTFYVTNCLPILLSLASLVYLFRDIYASSL